MYVIKSKAQLRQLPDFFIRNAIHSIIEKLELDYGEPYDPNIYGWFVVCDSLDELLKPLLNFQFSIAERIENNDYEFLEKKSERYELLLMLNDIEGILVYIPERVWQAYQHSRIGESLNTTDSNAVLSTQ